MGRKLTLITGDCNDTLSNMMKDSYDKDNNVFVKAEDFKRAWSDSKFIGYPIITEPKYKWEWEYAFEEWLERIREEGQSVINTVAIDGLHHFFNSNVICQKEVIDKINLVYDILPEVHLVISLPAIYEHMSLSDTYFRTICKVKHEVTEE